MIQLFCISDEELRADREACRVSVSRVYLNRGGYDRTGEYFGVGAPLFHAFNDSDDVNIHLRAADRADAVAEVRRRYPGSIFFRS